MLEGLKARRLEGLNAMEEEEGTQMDEVRKDSERYRKLEVWQLADSLALGVYRATKSFPNEEIYGITSQLRRAALSIPTNIVEGYARRGDRELARFVDIALGSLAETRYLLSFCAKLGYLSYEKLNELEGQGANLGGKLWKFYGGIRQGLRNSRRG